MNCLPPNRREKNEKQKPERSITSEYDFLQNQGVYRRTMTKRSEAQPSRTGPNRRGKSKHMQTCTEGLPYEGAQRENHEKIRAEGWGWLQWSKHLPHESEDLSSDPQNPSRAGTSTIPPFLHEMGVGDRRMSKVNRLHFKQGGRSGQKLKVVLCPSHVCDGKYMPMLT